MHTSKIHTITIYKYAYWYEKKAIVGIKIIWYNIDSERETNHIRAMIRIMKRGFNYEKRVNGKNCKYRVRKYV